jgi:hypothetical protein
MRAITITLKMATESVPETLEEPYTLTWLSAPEDFTELCRRESFKTHISVHV